MRARLAFAVSGLGLATSAIPILAYHSIPAHGATIHAVRVDAVRLNPALKALLPSAPEIRVVSAPLLAALMFDPFFDPPQTAATPAAAPAEQKKIRVEGIVLSSTHEPVKKPSLRLAMIGGPSAQMPVAYLETGDDAGKFVIEDVAPGIYSLTASKTGFVSSAYGARTPSSPGATITLEPGATVKNLEITLLPQAIVSGRVTSSNGEPTRANVTFYKATYAHGRKALQMTRLTPGTDDQGNYVTGQAVPPGRYYLSAQPRDQPADAEPGTSDVLTFYPNSLELAGAVAIDVPVGGRLEGIDIRARRTKTHSITGKVTFNGDLVKSTVLEVTPFGGGSINSGTSRLVGVTDGSFTVRNVVAGAYSIQVSRSVAPRPDQTFGVSGRLDVTVTDSDITGVELATVPGVQVSGSFKLDGGEWASLFAQPAAGQSGAPPVSYPSIGFTDPVVGFFNNPMRVNSDGTFKLVAVPAQKYLLDITGLPQGTYMKSMRYGGQDVTRSPLDLSTSSAALEIVLSKNAASVTGGLRTDKGDALTGVQVTLWPKDPNPGSATGGIKSVYTDQNGAFKFGNLAPGDYYAAAWDEIDSGLAQTPEFLAQFTSQAAKVTLSESSQANAGVKMIPKDTIAREVAKLQ